ncbi:MAG: DUF6056 family protein [Eubacterium sp.]
MFKRKYTLNEYLTFFAKLLPAIAALILAYYAPIRMDDWAWATSTGIERLDSFFSNYNGRYLGNLFIMALSRSDILWYISVVLAVMLFTFAIQKITESKSLTVYMFIPAMLFVMRTKMFHQFIMWRSGFSNYVPPILIAVLYIMIISNVMNDDAPEYKKGVPIITFILGITGTLFMEHVTIYALLLGVTVMVYSKIRFNRVYAAHASYLAGVALGCIIMFSNSAYLNIFKGNDANEYRTIGGSSLGYTIFSNATKISRWLLEYNVGLLTAFIVLFTILTFFYFKTKDFSDKKKKKIKIILGLQYAYAVFCWLFFFDTGLRLTAAWDAPRLIAAVLSYIGFVSLAVMLEFDRKTKTKLLFAILSAGALTVPLFVTTPVSARCLIPSYIMLILFASVLLNAALPLLSKKAFCAATAAVIAVFVAGSLYFCIGWGNVHYYENQRVEYINSQLESESSTIYILEYPKRFQRFTYGCDYIEDTVWEKRFCEYYGIDYETHNIEFTKEIK